MPKTVTGFQIADGRFYETAQEANYEETKLFLHTEAINAIQITQQHFPAFLDFIETNAELVQAHCENFIALQSFVNIVDVDQEELEKMREGVTINGTDKK